MCSTLKSTFHAYNTGTTESIEYRKVNKVNNSNTPIISPAPMNMPDIPIRPLDSVPKYLVFDKQVL
jgi:hypothetical protein